MSAYINDDLLCNGSDDMFPKRCVLTGEWYVRSVGYFENDILSVFAALLGNSMGYKDDYLGLEVHLKIGKTISVVGVDSSSI